MPINKRIVASQPGGPEQLQLQEEPLPLPQPDEVRVRVLAAGVAYGDVMLRQGKTPGGPPFPRTPGYDLVGEVDAVGSAVTTFQPGDRVAALPGIGSYTTYRCLPARDLVPVPATLKPAEVVSVLLNYTTAYQLLTRAAHLTAGQRVLIHGAAGGVGTAVLQLGRLLGLTVYGTASSGKQDVIRQAGGIPIDYTTTDFVAEIQRLTGGQGVDAVLDPIGGAHLMQSYQALGRKGTLVLFGAAAATQSTGNFMLGIVGTMLRVLLLKLRLDGRRVTIYTITDKANKVSVQADLARMVQWLSEGKISPVIAKVLPLSQAAEAQRLLEQTRPVGKIVLEP